MAEGTKIGWTDATCNFWIGCTEVSDACHDCYAIPIAARMGIGWGDNVPRYRTATARINYPRWHRMHERGQTYHKVKGELNPVPLWVFPNSLSDFFDNHPDLPPWRAEAWQIIRECWRLRITPLTKRIPNVLKMLLADRNGGRDYRHVGIIASVCNQMEFDRDLPRVVALNAHGVRWVGLSI